MRQREELERAGQKVLNYSKTELTLAMRFFSAALDRLPCGMDLRTRTIGTDGGMILFHPFWVLHTFVEQPLTVNRAYVHMLLHCLFRHVFRAPLYPDADLWDLCCDIAAESVADSMESRAVSRTVSDFREEWYRRLKEECGALTAEKLYRHFSGDLPYASREALIREFRLCDHSFWNRDPEKKDPETPDDGAGALPRRASGEDEKDWEKEAKRVRTELETFGKEAGHEAGNLARMLRLEYRRRTDYREFLQRFAVLRETAETDPDSFDYGYYAYGLRMYDNLPLIEEHELREVKKVEELVIALDTSASCQAALVERFLNETADLLSEPGSFFRKVRIRLIECDEEVRQDTLLEEPGDLRKYAGKFTLHGGMGTDFRPVFRHVKELRERGELRDLRGLVYFTDGFGPFPEEAPDYETAFVFRKDLEYDDSGVPDWALKLYV